MTIVDTPEAFLAAWRHQAPPCDRPATPRGVFLVEPVGFRLSGESASDNAYMDLARSVDPPRALAQHRVLVEAIRRATGLAVRVFAGSSATPDAVFPNNVYATAAGRVIVGAMRHPDRQREAQRDDIVDALAAAAGGGRVRLDREPGVITELTGPLVLDRGRGIGYHGRTERLNDAGVRATHAAFDLRLSFAFGLAPAEYHTNVVMAVLAARALVVHAGSFADPEVPRAIAQVYGAHVVWLGDDEKAAFAGNCIALAPDQVWMSALAERHLSQATRHGLARAGFVVHTVEIDEIEKAGGSLRCCIGELF
jgi:hypothetical protein